MTDIPTNAIVCVDDEAIILMSLKAQLRSHYKDKFLIETSSSGEEAITVIEDLIQSGVNVLTLISDWNMPNMRGDQLFKIIKNRFPEIKLILITGHADKETLNTLRNSIEILAVLNKPWDQKILQSYIDGLDTLN